MRNTQNSFLGAWLNYYAAKMRLARELGIMMLDHDGRWIENPLPGSGPEDPLDGDNPAPEELPLPPATFPPSGSSWWNCFRRNPMLPRPADVEFAERSMPRQRLRSNRSGYRRPRIPSDTNGYNPIPNRSRTSRFATGYNSVMGKPRSPLFETGPRALGLMSFGPSWTAATLVVQTECNLLCAELFNGLRRR